jgi:ABC-2 type transport system permease protein
MGKRIDRIRTKIEKHWFLFTELVKRDFKQKYKRTVLGIFWSVLNPLLSLLVMTMIFKNFFGRTQSHYTIYLFSGNIIMSYFREATRGGMGSLVSNSGIITKINVPKYLFLLSKNVSALLNFLITFVIYLIFIAIDGISFSWNFIMLLYPIACLCIFSVGVGMLLSSAFVFFRDTTYLYEIGMTLLTYLSAIFYTLDAFSPTAQRLFLLNPIYTYIKFFRLIVIEGTFPSIQYFILCIGYALAALGLGILTYKGKNRKFMYYI